MAVISDITLKELRGIIDPFFPEQVKVENGKKIVSYGLSSYGYDVRVEDRFLVYKNTGNVIDPKDFDDSANFDKVWGRGHVIIPPNSFVLCQTIEHVRVPRGCVVFVAAKSTYARCGLVTNATILEPDWEGRITLELSNTAPLPLKVYGNEGIVQLLFVRGDKVCEVSYADRKGKYQNQREITLPKV